MNGESSDIRTQAPRTYQVLREQIVLGRLPPLQKLKIADLAAAHAVSPGAVREALSRLTTDHLVEARDQRGFRVAAISVAELEDLTETRVQIETLALRQAIARGDAQWQAAVRQAHCELAAWPARPDDFRGAALHARFHAALVEGCGSASLLRVRNALYDQSERYRFVAARRGLARRPVAAEHAAIAAATLDRDADTAADALRDHIRLTTGIVRAVLEASGA